MPAWKKEVGEVIKIARKCGWEVTGMTGSGHWRLRHDGGAIMILAATPNGGNRWRKNALARIQRADAKDSQ